MRGGIKIISILAAIVFVGLVAYWVITESLPLPAPQVTYSAFPQEVRSNIIVPYSCEAPFRVFRSNNEGVSWDRVMPATYTQKESACVFPDTYANVEQGVSRLMYRYALVRPRRNISHWSEITSVPLSPSAISE